MLRVQMPLRSLIKVEWRGGDRPHSSVEEPMIVYESNDGIAVLTLDKPPANTFDSDTLRQLRDLIAQMNADRSIRAAVIIGRGEKFFSAGAELKELHGNDSAHAHALIRHFGAAFGALQEARPVVIAAINGYAMGGGLECALCCDMRIAEEHAQLALPEASVGLLPGGTGTQTLPWLVGEGWAKRMILTNERVNAALALRIGLVEEVVASGQALDAALKVARRVVSLSPEAVEYSKSLIHLAHRGIPRDAAHAVERERFVDLCEGRNWREGIEAFLGKRQPQWQSG
jgi:enoyl-CoA hydratase/carnithine racemase